MSFDHVDDQIFCLGCLFINFIGSWAGKIFLPFIDYSCTSKPLDSANFITKNDIESWDL